ncbi:DgyrCDS10737 [Dimorphilus gyrociliatus]|uniref:DgyrCDS10737 n=1 Tax=Dimorphilus gyrociliatus TaxID=2664684 RepID=A0A7I8W671_9ANNE|nr:DgyrCDS10737 [Dimorphilus gyrociliatus]
MLNRRLLGLICSYKRVGTVDRLKNNAEKVIKYPTRENLEFRTMRKGEEGSVAQLFVKGFVKNLSYITSKEEFPSLEKFYKKSFEYDEENRKNFLVAYHTVEKRIIAICRIRDSNRVEKNLPISVMFKMLSAKTVLGLLCTFGSFDLLNKQIVENEQIIEFLTVCGKHKGKDLGRTMMQCMESVGKERNASKLSMVVHAEEERALKMYESEGYKITHIIHSLKSVTFGNKVSFKMEKAI